MKQTALLVALGALVFLVSAWLLMSGIVHGLAYSVFHMRMYDAHFLPLGLLVGIVFGAPLGYRLRDHVLLRSFLVILPTIILLVVLPIVLFGEGVSEIRILGATTMVVSFCGFSFLAHRTWMRLNPGQADAIKQRNNTNQYKIFKNSVGVIEALKQGWSWPAFFFTAFWALAKKMWLLGVGAFIGIFVGAGVFGAIANAIASSVRDGGFGLFVLITIIILATIGVPLILGIIFGAKGNSWREKNLASRAFEQVGIVTANSPNQAITLWSKPNEAER